MIGSLDGLRVSSVFAPAVAVMQNPVRQGQISRQRVKTGGKGSGNSIAPYKMDGQWANAYRARAVAVASIKIETDPALKEHCLFVIRDSERIMRERKQSFRGLREQPANRLSAADAL